MVKLKYKLGLKPPNLLIWRDTLYVEYKDGSSISLSLLSKLAKLADDYLAGKISEIVVESDEIDVKLSAPQVKAIAQGLAIEYLFWEGSGTTVNDTSGNANHGSFGGSTAQPSWNQLPNGRYYVSFPDVTNSNAYIKSTKTVEDWWRTNCTIEIVVRFHAKSTGSLWHQLFQPYSHKNCLFYNQGSKILGWHGTVNGTWTFVFDTGYFEPEKWHHIVVRLSVNPDGTGNYEYIKNASEKWSKSKAPLFDPAGGDNVAIGSPGVTAEYLCSDIALVRLFIGRALTDSEIQVLYKLAKIMVPELP